jgi:hypothetical protein
MRKRILSSVLDVCQNIIDSDFFGDGRFPIWDIVFSVTLFKNA